MDLVIWCVADVLVVVVVVVVHRACCVVIPLWLIVATTTGPTGPTLTHRIEWCQLST